MKKSAKEFGIDLDDPIVKQELNRLKNEKKLQKSDKKDKKNKSILKPSQTEKKVYNYKWWVLIILAVFTSFYLYRPNESELW